MLRQDFEEEILWLTRVDSGACKVQLEGQSRYSFWLFCVFLIQILRVFYTMFHIHVVEVHRVFPRLHLKGKFHKLYCMFFSYQFNKNRVSRIIIFKIFKW
jgi:hypothetical protein